MLLSDLDELEDMLDDIIVDSEKENSEHHDSEDDCEYESKSEEDVEPPCNTDDFINRLDIKIYKGVAFIFTLNTLLGTVGKLSILLFKFGFVV